MRESELTLSLVVIRSSNIERALAFYNALGLQFDKHRHGTGPEHLTAILRETVFEIYPSANLPVSTSGTRLGFRVPKLKRTLDSLKKLGGTILSEPSQTPFGFCAVAQDFDGHKVEIYEMN